MQNTNDIDMTESQVVLELIKATSVLAARVSVDQMERFMAEWDRETAEFFDPVWWHREFLAAFVEYRSKLHRIEQEC